MKQTDTNTKSADVKPAAQDFGKGVSANMPQRVINGYEVIPPPVKK
jgi:hypothetical protein